MPRPASHSRSLGTRSAAAGTPGFEMMPTVLMSGIQQKFPVAFRAQNRAIHQGRDQTELFHRFVHSLARLLMQFGAAHNSTLAHLALPHFKLRLDEYNHA